MDANASAATTLSQPPSPSPFPILVVCALFPRSGWRTVVDFCVRFHFGPRYNDMLCNSFRFAERLCRHCADCIYLQSTAIPPPPPPPSPPPHPLSFFCFSLFFLFSCYLLFHVCSFTLFLPYPSSYSFNHISLPVCLCVFVCMSLYLATCISLSISLFYYYVSIL